MFGTAVAQSTLTGTLTNSKDQKPVFSAEISLFRSGRLLKTVHSNKEGKFVFSKIAAAKYDLQVKHKDYKTLDKKGIIVATNITKAIKIQLDKIIIIPPEIVTDDLDVEYDMVVECDAAFSIPQGTAQHNWTSKSQADFRVTPMNTESYDFIKENTFQNTHSNPLSTFSIDVDRASYANMRRFINRNQMPPKDAIRIEEMINYFDYSYPQPTDEHPFSINLEGGACPWNPQHQIVHIGLQGKKLVTEEIPSNNLVFLLDVSGSMSSPNKLPLLKKSFSILLDQMRPQDRVAIVVYAGAAGLILPSTNDKRKIREALNNLNAGGSTAGGQGIKLAYKIALENFIKEGNNRIILATDGDFNVGTSDNGSLVRLIEEKRKSSVFLSILGFGMGNYKDAKMEQLSNAGNGNYAYIDNILEANKIFGKEIWGTLFTIAKDVKIQIEFNPIKVQGYRLIGYENRMLENKDFKNDTIDAGEIGAGHSVTAIYEIIPAGIKSKWAPIDSLKYQKIELSSSSSEICTVKFRYKKPDGNTSIELMQSMNSKEVKINGENSNNYNWTMAVSEFGMLLRDSKYKGNTTFKDILVRAKDAKGSDEFGYRAEFIQLVKKAKLLNN